MSRGVNPVARPLWGRVVVAVLLAAALWDPGLPGLRGPQHLVVLLDDSASLGAEAVNAAWRSLAPTLGDLPAGGRLSLVRFGARPVTEAAALAQEDAGQVLLAGPLPPRRLALSDRHTDIGAALAAGLGLAIDGLDSTLLLISDGEANFGYMMPALAAARARGVPVLWWRPPGAAAEADAWIARLDVPRRVEAGAPTPLNLVLGADAPLMTDLVIREGHRPLVRQSLHLAPEAPMTLGLSLDLQGTGVHELMAELEAADRVQANNVRGALTETAGKAAVLLIAPRPSESVVAASLSDGGWPLAAISPAHFGPAILQGHRVLILEGMAAADLPEADWQAIAREVRQGGMGLVVLGGPGTFAAGGYRHSTLEGLLPVLAEAPRPLPPAAIVFAVDRSGSMEQATRVGASRLELARAAVLGSARSLSPGDEVGLVAFDTEARAVLPPARCPDQAAAMEAAWDLSPSGGTRLGPALDLSLSLLAEAQAPDRLLVLATDGRVADADGVQAMADRIAAAGVTLVAIAIGEEADAETLGRLTAAGKGRLLRATDAAELPSLMQAEVHAQRSSLGEGPVEPRLLAPLPFAPGMQGPLPPLAAYQVTRPRPDAAVYLAAEGGEPLLAASLSGTGRVVALPGGLGPWASAWTSWPGWAPFVGGLVQWSAGAGAPSLHLRTEDRAESIALTMEVLDGGDWAQAPALPVGMRDPAGGWHRLSAPVQAPGRYALEIPAPLPGRYDLIAGPQGQEQRLALLHQPLAELLPGDGGELASAARDGLVRPWSPRDGVPAPRAQAGARPRLAALALALFLAVVALERLPPAWRQAIAWPRRPMNMARNALHISAMAGPWRGQLKRILRGRRVA